MQATEIISFVRNIINEHVAIPDEFSIETDEALSSFMLAAMKQIVLSPGFQCIPATMNEGNIAFKQRPDGMYFAIISAPSDCLSPVSIFLDGWVTPVFSFHPVTDSIYQAQLSSVKGIGNGPNLPVAFLLTQQDTVIIAHAVHTPGKYEFRYIPEPKINSEDQIVDFPEMYRECLAYTAAALYLQSVNEYDASKMAFEIASTYLQTINKQ